MPPRAQKRKVSAQKPADSPRRAAPPPTQTSSTPAPRAQPPQKDAKSAAYILLAFPMLGTIAACSLATWAYKRALDPLYGTIPTDIHLNKAIWAGQYFTVVHTLAYINIDIVRHWHWWISYPWILAIRMDFFASARHIRGYITYRCASRSRLHGQQATRCCVWTHRDTCHCACAICDLRSLYDQGHGRECSREHSSPANP